MASTDPPWRLALTSMSISERVQMDGLVSLNLDTPGCGMLGWIILYPVCCGFSSSIAGLHPLGVSNKIPSPKS